MKNKFALKKIMVWMYILQFSTIFSVHSVSLVNEKTSPKPFRGKDIAPVISNNGKLIYGISEAFLSEQQWQFASSVWSFDGSTMYSKGGDFQDWNNVYLPQAVSEDESTVYMVMWSGSKPYQVYACSYNVNQRTKLVPAHNGFYLPSFFPYPYACALNQDGSLAAISFRNGQIYIHSVSNPSKHIILPFCSGEFSFSIKWQGERFLSFGDNPGRIAFWDLTSQKITQVIHLPSDVIYDVNVCPSTGDIVVVSEDKLLNKNYIRVLNSLGKLILTKEESSMRFIWAQLSEDGETLAALSVGMDGALTKKHTLNLWRISKQEQKPFFTKDICPGVEIDTSFFDVKWIQGELIHWAFYNGVTGSIGT